jgi:hypothetical protein
MSMFSRSRLKAESNGRAADVPVVVCTLRAIAFTVGVTSWLSLCYTLAVAAISITRIDRLATGGFCIPANPTPI